MPENNPKNIGQTVDYSNIFKEEGEKIKIAYPSSNFVAGSREVFELPRNTNERVTTEALRSGFEQRGLQASSEKLATLARIYVMCLESMNVSSTIGLEGINGGENSDVQESVKSAFEEIPSRTGRNMPNPDIHISIEGDGLRIG